MQIFQHITPLTDLEYTGSPLQYPSTAAVGG